MTRCARVLRLVALIYQFFSALRADLQFTFSKWPPPTPVQVRVFSAGFAPAGGGGIGSNRIQNGGHFGCVTAGATRPALHVAFAQLLMHVSMHLYIHTIYK